METSRKRVKDEDLITYATFEKYYKKFIRDDEEEMDVDYLGLSSHS